MSLKAVGLSEARMTDITFVGFLSSVNAKMSLQFERIRTGVGAMWTLIRSFTSVASHMAFQLA